MDRIPLSFYAGVAVGALLASCAFAGTALALMTHMIVR
jgi:hypothetical protein